MLRLQSMKDILRQFGKRVRELRKAQRLSQENLAEKAGLHYTYIGGVERGERNLSLKVIKKIADALKIDIRELFAGNLYENIDVENKVIINDINRLLVNTDIHALQLIKILVKTVDEWIQGNIK